MTILRLLFLIARLPGRAFSWWFDGVRHPGSTPLNGFMRGAISALTWFFAFVLTAQAFLPGPIEPQRPSAAPQVRVERATAQQAQAPTGRERMIPSDWVAVARVVDGDTLDLADGRTVRVLGIDSCEMSTPRGPDAKSQAEKLLADGRVRLQPQAGAPDVDRYGRLLRYVQTPAGDFGTLMVGYDHTGVYQGDNDASDSYLDQLYAHDRDHALTPPPAGRNCGETAPRPEVDRDDGTASKPEVSGPFSSCKAARAAGAAPVRIGDPGYSRKLDRDGDGVGCE